jgi:hypothetical protein
VYFYLKIYKALIINFLNLLVCVLIPEIWTCFLLQLLGSNPAALNREFFVHDGNYRIRQ